MFNDAGIFIKRSRRKGGAPYKHGHPTVVAKDVFPELGIEVLVAEIFLERLGAETTEVVQWKIAAESPQRRKSPQKPLKVEA